MISEAARTNSDGGRGPNRPSRATTTVQQSAREADQLDDLTDLIAANAWRPTVHLPRLSPAERAKLQIIFDCVTAERRRGEIAKEARRARRAEEPRSARWVDAALEAEADIVRAASVGLRNDTLARSAWSLARFTCDGTLTEGEVLEVLVPASLSTGLGLREIHACIRAALRKRCAAA